MNLRTTIKAMNLRTTLKAGAIVLACGAILLLGMSSFAQQGEQGDFLRDYLKVASDAPKPPPEEPTEPESFSGLGSASLDVKVDRTVCVGAPAPPTQTVCSISGAGSVAALSGNRGLVRLVVMVRDQGGSPIDLLGRGSFELVGAQFIPFGGPALEILPASASTTTPPPTPPVDLGFTATGHGVYRFFVRPAGTANWVAGSYFVEVNAGTARELVQIDIP